MTFLLVARFLGFVTRCIYAMWIRCTIPVKGYLTLHDILCSHLVMHNDHSIALQDIETVTYSHRYFEQIMLMVEHWRIESKDESSSEQLILLAFCESPDREDGMKYISSLFDIEGFFSLSLFLLQFLLIFLIFVRGDILKRKHYFLLSSSSK